MPDEPEMEVSVQRGWHHQFGYYYTLDRHKVRSTYTGDNQYGYPTFDTVRTPAGEAVYQLKYRRDFSQAQVLAGLVHQHIVPRLEAQIGLVIPMPASTQRARQPVTEVASALAELLGINAWDNILQKADAENAPSLKNLDGWQAKMAALKGRFVLNEAITDEGRWNAILLDDLYDTGASMQTAMALLKSYRKLNKVFFVALTRKSST